jgi:integrase
LIKQAFVDRKYRLAAHSYQSDEWRAPKLLKWFGPMPAEKVTTTMIRDRLQELVDEGLAPATVNRYKALLSAVFQWGINMEKLKDNPARRISNFKEPRLRRRFLSPEEEKALREGVQLHYPDQEPELDLALYTGMRRNEIYRLEWTQVDFKLGLITVEGKAHANSSAPSDRIIRMHPDARKALEELRRRAGFSRYVCPGPHDGTETERDWREWFESAAKKAGIQDFTYHDLRHTFASRLRMSGVELTDIAEILGHRSLAMVMRYAHVSEDYLKTAIEKLPGKQKPAEPVAPGENVVAFKKPGETS